MRTLAFVLTCLCALPAFADPPPHCYQKTITVCPLKKHPPKPAVKPDPIVIEKVVEVEKPVPAPYPVTTTKYVQVPGPTKVVLKCPVCPPEGPVVAGLHLGMGLGVRDPYTTGMVGFRLQFPKAYLGLEVFSALQYGFGAQLLTYVYRHPKVQVHVGDPGVMLPVFGHYLSDADIPRNVDLMVGAGVQAKITCHLAFTADVRASIPDPGKLARKDCVGSDRIIPGNAVGNAFAASQLVVGLLIHE